MLNLIFLAFINVLILDAYFRIHNILDEVFYVSPEKPLQALLSHSFWFFFSLVG